MFMERQLMTSPKAAALKAQLRIPAIAAPLFIISNPKLVIAQCTSGIVGSFPALNARPATQLDEWLHEITEGLTAWNTQNPSTQAAPFAVNQIVHKSNGRLEHDVAACVKWKVPLVITSLGARPELNDAIHSYGGMTLHDVININHSRKGLEKGADGLIAVATGAGGHAGKLSPFALIQEIRQFFDGPLALSGAIATGRAVLAAEAMGADFGYIGSLFIATTEANASAEYKQGLVDGHAEDIVYSDLFTGVHGNYLRESIVRSGMDPDNLPTSDPSKMDFGSGGNTDAKAWKDIWGCGQGIGIIDKIEDTATIVAHLAKDYHDAKIALCTKN
jgi:nitronate monooxygenase